MSYIEKEKLIKADIASIENRVRHVFNQGYDLGFKDGQKRAKPLEQEPTTKKDLGVDCVSRQAVLALIADYDLSMGQVVKGIHALPSVTPQEPRKGHWIEQIDHEENCRTLICSNCDRPALHDEDSIWKHKFCPHCGAKMVEEQGENT